MQIFNGALLILKEYFVPYLSIYFDSLVVTLFSQIVQNCEKQAIKGKRAHSDVPATQTLSLETCQSLLPELFQLVQLNF